MSISYFASSIIVSDGSSNLRVFLFSLLLFASHKTNISSQLDRGIHIVYFGRLNGGDLDSLGLDGSEGMGYNTPTHHAMPSNQVSFYLYHHYDNVITNHFMTITILRLQKRYTYHTQFLYANTPPSLFTRSVHIYTRSMILHTRIYSFMKSTLLTHDRNES